MKRLVPLCVLFAAMAPQLALAYPNPDTMQYNNKFEVGDAADWQPVGYAQFVRSMGGSPSSHSGRNFVRLAARAPGEWASINHWQDVRAGDACVYAVWVKTSAELTNGYITVRRDGGGGNQGAIMEERVLAGLRPAGSPADNGYQLFEIDFSTGNSTRLLFYVGMYGNGKDSWVEVDDVTILCDPLGPAEAGNSGGSDPNGMNRRRPQNF